MSEQVLKSKALDQSDAQEQDAMQYRELFVQVHQRPGMYGLDGSFAHCCNFLQGCHAGSAWTLLAGWREWLVMHLGKVYAGNNLAWPALVLKLAFPEGWHMRKRRAACSLTSSCAG